MALYMCNYGTLRTSSLASYQHHKGCCVYVVCELLRGVFDQDFDSSEIIQVMPSLIKQSEHAKFNCARYGRMCEAHAISFLGTLEHRTLTSGPVVDATLDMADDSQLAEATQALSFAEFLERMKDPQAANLVRSIKKYVFYRFRLHASAHVIAPILHLKPIESVMDSYDTVVAVLSRHLTRKLVIRTRTPKACR